MGLPCADRRALVPPFLTKRQRSSLDECSERIDDVATFEAAARAISQEIVEKGSISTSRCTEIIQEKERVSDLLLYYFPGAISGLQVYTKVKNVAGRLGLTRENSLFAKSICPDEINHEDGDLPDLLSRHFSHAFHLGGLAGVPFTGKTGFAAFKHHVPDNGHAFVLMAPHIGLSLDNELGKFSRHGQTQAGSACGAAVGAFAHCCAGKEIPSLEDNFDDHEMAYIIREVGKCVERIQDAGDDSNSQQAMLAKQTHDIAKNMLDHIVDVEFGGDQSNLVVLTGIQVNMPRPFQNFFQPMTFARHTKDGQVEDLLTKLFLNSRTIERDSCKTWPCVLHLNRWLGSVLLLSMSAAHVFTLGIMNRQHGYPHPIEKRGKQLWFVV
eukprot:scaffold16502_cov177-Amphora_coffeaeformis.AAC.1